MTLKNNLYGVDIDSGAIEIAKLRIWLSLIVDYDKSEIKPLPNLDFQFRVGNSLQEKIDEIDIFRESAANQQDLFKTESTYDKMKRQMIDIKDRFYESENETEKRRLKTQFDELEHKLILTVLKKYRQDYSEQLKHQHIPSIKKTLQKIGTRIDELENKIKDGTYKLFKPDFHFSEVFDRKNDAGQKTGGFDIVIGNPPYGVAVDEDIKKAHKLGSKDSYGAFISTALMRFLKPGGVLSFIVSDTWLTIKSHRDLRRQVLEKQLHKVLRLHQDCFEATVNACIMSLSNDRVENSALIAADLTNISTRKQVRELREKLYGLETYVGKSTPNYAVYKYPQNLVEEDDNVPIFTSNPELFKTIMISKGHRSPSDKARDLGKAYSLIKLSDTAEIKYGIRTGDNSLFFYQDAEARSNYRCIEQFKKNILNKNSLHSLTEYERLNGIEPSNHKDQFIVPLDKGGESDADEHWLPCYY